MKPSEPIYIGIKDAIKRRIENGEFNETGQLPGERILAQKYSISHPTMNKAISMLVNEGLLERGSAGKGTYIRTNRYLKTAFVFIYAKEGHVFYEMSHKLMQKLLCSGFNPSLLDIDSYKKMRNDELSALLDKDWNISIIELTWQFPFDILKRLSMQNMVFFLRKETRIPMTGCHILADYEEGGYQALRYLNEQGSRRILVLGYEVEKPFLSICDFYRGIERAAEETGIMSVQYLNTDDKNYLPVAKELLIKNKIDGIISLGDFRVIPVLKIMQKMNIPRDAINVVGYYNTPWSDAYHFSSFALNWEEMISILDEELRHNRFDGRFLIKPKLIQRNTL